MLINVIFLFLKKCIRVTLFYQLHEQEQKQHPMKYTRKKNESFYGIYMQHNWITHLTCSCFGNTTNYPLDIFNPNFQLHQTSKLFYFQITKIYFFYLCNPYEFNFFQFTNYVSITFITFHRHTITSEAFTRLEVPYCIFWFWESSIVSVDFRTLCEIIFLFNRKNIKH